VDGRNRQVAGIDLGRHRSFITVDDGGGPQVVRLSRHHEGLVVRLAEEPGPVRRPLDVLTGEDHAGGFTALAGDALALIVAPVRSQEVLTDGALALAVPVGWGPARRRWFAGAAARAGLGAGGVRVVVRPEAALAAWLTGRGLQHLPHGFVVAVDLDGGACSASVASLAPGGFVASMELGLHLDPAQAPAVAHRLRRLVGVAAVLCRARSEALSWNALAARVAVVITSGTGAEHPALGEMLGQLFPASDRAPALADPALAVGAGLVCLERLSGLRSLGPVPISGPQPVDDVQPQLGGHAEGVQVDPLVVTVEPAEELAGPD
jgi:hypothetical protein